jgi:LPS sulfotransferase NodH
VSATQAGETREEGEVDEGLSEPLPASSQPDLLDEAALTSSRHDCPPSAGPRARLVICTTPRSGSYLLSRLLIRAGLGVPHEYLNPVNAAPIRQRAGRSGRPLRPEEYLDWLDEHRTTTNGVFATKVHWSQLATDPLAIDRWVLGEPAPVLVFLYRRGISAQAHSLQDAARTGVWDSSGQRSTTPPRGLAAVGFDDIDRLTFRVMHWNAMWRLGFEAWERRPLDVAYEDLVADQPGTITRIADALGVPVVPPPTEPAPVVDVALARERRERILAYARSWVPPTASPPPATRRLARAVALDVARGAARRVYRGVVREPHGDEDRQP